MTAARVSHAEPATRAGAARPAAPSAAPSAVQRVPEPATDTMTGVAGGDGDEEEEEEQGKDAETAGVPAWAYALGGVAVLGIAATAIYLARRKK